ncbi:hypothetical protein GUJ93_ZPchr0002g23929 [Zizania palustris]|uniref:Uncharacterized protein n=1 Tax=Zizania palustris TaxID=103762 RepID=A0A8J5SQ75_ZIZPA|nr:hypothetical protein GUJ93_ZPchr0002g23929 [Zizania palustris]
MWPTKFFRFPSPRTSPLPRHHLHATQSLPPPCLPAASARLRPPLPPASPASRRLCAPWSPTRQAEEKEERAAAASVPPPCASPTAASAPPSVRFPDRRFHVAVALPRPRAEELRGGPPTGRVRVLPRGPRGTVQGCPPTAASTPRHIALAVSRSAAGRACLPLELEASSRTCWRTAS